MWAPFVIVMVVALVVFAPMGLYFARHPGTDNLQMGFYAWPEMVNLAVGNMESSAITFTFGEIINGGLDDNSQ